jgi:hypothetical protein
VSTHKFLLKTERRATEEDRASNMLRSTPLPLGGITPQQLFSISEKQHFYTSNNPQFISPLYTLSSYLHFIITLLAVYFRFI